MKYLSFLFLFLCLSCNFPQDPKHSFQEAQATKLRVGVVFHPPFVINEPEKLTGIEIDLIESFAAQEKLQIDYVTGTESELVEKLEKYDLHVVLGGFEKKTVWMKKTGLTVPYDGKHVLLIAKGENKLLFKLEKFIFKNSKGT